MSMPNAKLRIAPPQDAADHAWLASLWRKEWGDELMVTRGYRFAAIYPGAITEARKIKPSIPMEGDYGIPVRDDLELPL